MLWISFLCTNKPSVAPCCLHICDSCTRIAQEKSGERYPNSVVSFGLNRAYIKGFVGFPVLAYVDKSVQAWFFEYGLMTFLGFVLQLGRLVDTSEEYIKVILCIRRCISFFFGICYIFYRVHWILICMACKSWSKLWIFKLYLLKDFYYQCRRLNHWIFTWSNVSWPLGTSLQVHEMSHIQNFESQYTCNLETM